MQGNIRSSTDLVPRLNQIVSDERLNLNDPAELVIMPMTMNPFNLITCQPASERFQNFHRQQPSMPMGTVITFSIQHFLIVNFFTAYRKF
jgi:hypothetical protein